MPDFLKTLQTQVILLDGAMGTMIQNLDLPDASYGGNEFKMLTDLLTLSEPEKIKNLHLTYYRAGANAVETNTFGASRLRLAEYDFTRIDKSPFPKFGTLDMTNIGMNELAYQINKQASALACQAREEHAKDPDYDGRPLFVVGSMGPSNWVLSATEANLRKATWEEIVDNFYHQVLGLIDGGADVVLHETQQDILELKAAVFGSRKAMKERGKTLPIMAQITVDQFGKMQIFNTDLHAAIVTMHSIGVDVFGINCSIGPDLMEASIKKLSAHCPMPFSVIPNAGLPESLDGKTVFKMDPVDMARHMERYVSQYGVQVIGGCCGTTPRHIQAMRQMLKGRGPSKRIISTGKYLSGPQRAIAFNSEKGLIRIGERLNVRGSKKVRDAIENGAAQINHEVLDEVVREQVRDLGVEVIDVCMDSNLVSTMEALPEVIHRQTVDFSGAMCLDSFDADALAEAIKVYPGRPIVNSISMEEFRDGISKVDAIGASTAEHGPMYIALCTSPKGPAMTAEEKVDVARQIMEAAAVHGIQPGQLIVDPNIFPLGSESDESVNFALETLNSLPLIKALHPDIMTTVGIGNLTNGLAKKPYMRTVLTSVFIEEGRKRGLDAAIINPHHYVPVESLDAGDVELARRAILHRDMDAFAKLEEIASTKAGKDNSKKNNYDTMPLYESICAKVVDGFKDRAEGAVEIKGHRYAYKDKIVLQVAQTVDAIAPLDFVNQHLMAAMKVLGDGFAAGDVSLPHLLKSADVMKQIMTFLETYMKVQSGAELSDKVSYKGTIVIGTVYQDVHSIGKDLAKTLLENYGYRVIDLGVQVPLQKFIDTAVEYNADAIGMSALLVQTSNHMITVAKMLDEQGLGHINIMIGGAPVNTRHAGYVAMHGQDDLSRIHPGVFYCQTGMDGVKTMDRLKGPDAQQLLRDNRTSLEKYYKKAKQFAENEAQLLQTLPRRVIKLDQPLPGGPWLAQGLMSMSMRELKPHLNLKNLFSLNWFFGSSASRDKKKVSESELLKLLDDWIERCDLHGWLQPKAVYGLYPCQANGDSLMVYHPENHVRELARIQFDPVIGSERQDVFSAAQFFRPLSSDAMDKVGLQISTGGSKADLYIEQFKQDGDNESALYLQGLSDRVAEDMATLCHARLREITGTNPRAGTRYSPGYPALKDVGANRVLFDLLDANKKLGIGITDAGEFSPTGTTGAVVCFFPAASYG